MPKQSFKKRPCLIFDLDGTLYSFKGGQFRGSPLQKRVFANARGFVAAHLSVSQKTAREVLARIIKLYGEEISIGLEKEFGLNRYEYFETVWNIPARGLVAYPRGLRPLLLRLQKKYNLFLISDAPKVWISNVLRALRVADIFEGNIFSGEGDIRKGFGNVFKVLPRRVGCAATQCVVVGDQEKTDIVPAKAAGLKAIFVNKRIKSSHADASIKRVSELENTLRIMGSQDAPTLRNVCDGSSN